MSITDVTERAEKPTDLIESLRELLAGDRDDEVLAIVAKLVSRNRELELLLAKRAARNPGEKLTVAQLDLFLNLLKAEVQRETAEQDAALTKAADEHKRPEDPPKPKQPPVRRPPPAHLRRVDNPISVPDDQRPCPGCGGERHCVGHEINEVIELVPAEVIVRRDQREVLACRACDGELQRAPAADKVVTGGAYGPSLVASLVVGKYRYGLPLNRQREELERLGLPMPASSMADQITWATDLLRPIWRELWNEVLTARVLHVDGTGLPVRDKDAVDGIVTGTLWGYVGGSSAMYLYTSTGKRDGQRQGELGPADFLMRRRGPICADASNLFDPLFTDGKRVEIGCNMHARRYFVKALEAGDARAAIPLKAFQALYAIEHEVRDKDEAARTEARMTKSRAVYKELLTWCAAYQPNEPPSSLLGRAIGYVINHAVALTRFLEDGGLPIDNGIVERLHRRPAVGRRNYLFAGSHAGGERAAIAYSVLASCDLCDVDPVAYLGDVLPRLARESFTVASVRDLLPSAWAAARRTAA